MGPTTAARARSADQTNGRERGAGANGRRDTVLFFMGMVTRKVRRERSGRWDRSEERRWRSEGGVWETVRAGAAAENKGWRYIVSPLRTPTI
jgi:hypothetical protein